MPFSHNPESEEFPSIDVRNLRPGDTAALTRIDHRITGRSRSAWYEGRVKRALTGSDLNVSLVATVDDKVVGAVLGSLHYGEYGQPEPSAVLDTILVDPALAGQGVGRALMRQLLRNLGALRIETLRTEVAWDEQGLIGFLAKSGFHPAPRLVLEAGVADAARRLEG